MTIHFRDIVRVVSTTRKMPTRVIFSPERTSPTAQARQEIAAFAREMTDMSLPQIGRKLGRDHTTVLHSLRAVEKRKASAGYRRELDRMRSDILATQPIFTRNQTPVFRSVRS